MQTSEVMTEGAAPLLVKLLHDDDPQIKKEAAWALSNILAGTGTQVNEVLECNALPIFVKLLSDVSEGDVITMLRGCCNNAEGML